jgi:sterol desaturase/sphingolipid hydroxylase (fatty acid hydroxylase superfamily)
MIIVSAITVVRAAQTQGMSIPEGAALNAPVFILFSKIALGAAFGLLLGESLAYAAERRMTKLDMARAATSVITMVCAMVFAFVFVPPMQDLLPRVKTDAAAHAEFHKLHESSRGVFSVMMLSALLSLLIPVFAKGASEAALDAGDAEQPIAPTTAVG